MSVNAGVYLFQAAQSRLVPSSLKQSIKTLWRSRSRRFFQLVGLLLNSLRL